MRRNVNDGMAVELTANQLKRIEKVFIAAGVPHFTNGVISWANVTGLSESITAGKYVVNAQDMIAHIKDNDLADAIKTEFAGVDLQAWFKANKVHYSQLIKVK